MVAFKRLKISQDNDFTTVFLLYYLCFKMLHKMIPIDLGKQQEIDADPKAMQQINFSGNLHRTRNATMFLFLKDRQKRNCESFVNLFYFNIISV